MAEKMLNINLEHGKRKRITVNDDETRVVELNTSDLGIFGRIDAFDKTVTTALQEFAENQIENDDEDFDIVKIGEELNKLDKLIRGQLDILFDTNFSAIVAPYGTMLDPVNGEFRFQYLLGVFSALYENQIATEFKERNETVRKHTKKYVNKVNK